MVQIKVINTTLSDLEKEINSAIKDIYVNNVNCIIFIKDIKIISEDISKTAIIIYDIKVDLDKLI